MLSLYSINIKSVLMTKTFKSAGITKIKEITYIKLVFPFNTKTLDNVRTLTGRAWHPKGKFWTASLTLNNVKALESWGFLVDTLLPYFNNEKKAKPLKIKGLNGTLFPYQTDGVNFIESRGGSALIADEMGCVSGDNLININFGGASSTISLRKFYKKYSKSTMKHKFKVRVLKDDVFGLHSVQNVLYKGVKQVLQIKTKSGKHIEVTPDHEVLTNKGYIAAEKLSVGSIVIINGTTKCIDCGSTENIITYKYSKFVGYCKNCMYTKHRKNKNGTGRWIDSDGYVKLNNKEYKDNPRYNSTGIYEHIIVMEKEIGHYIPRNLEIHHINGIKTDNRISNLELLSSKDHKKRHTNTYKHFGLHIVPKEDLIISIKYLKDHIDVYDIVMEDPYRNFVVNGITVHNCGKTIQAIAWMHLHPEERPALIVCPASLKLNWERELFIWTKGTVITEIISGTKVYPLNSDIAIINYDILPAWLKELKKSNLKTIVLDEAHYIKNSGAKRTKATMSLTKVIPNKILLTGTPVESRPSELYNIIKILDPLLFGNKWDYMMKYCGAKHNGFGWDFSGATEIEELHSKLTSTIMIRRKKADVLKDLPDKTYSFVPISIDNRKEYNEAEKDFIEYVKLGVELKVRKKLNDLFTEDYEGLATIVDHKLQRLKDEAGLKAEEGGVLVKIEILKQLAAAGKLKDTLQWIDNFLESGEKLVVFAVHKFVIDTLMETYKDIAVKIDGSVTSMTKRQKAVDDFQNVKRIKLFVGNIKAAGVGLTLTAASNVVFLEYPWNPGQLNQAIDRCHRITQKNAVNVYYLCGVNTIEESIARMLNDKQKVVDSLLDGKAMDSTSLLDDLVDSFNQ